MEGLIVSREIKRSSRQSGGIRQNRRIGGLGWLENPDEGAPHTKRGCRKDVRLDEKETESMQREREGDREERRKKQKKQRKEQSGRETDRGREEG